MNIPTDFYYPPNGEIDNFNGITILILQGVEVDKKEYRYLAENLAEKGYRVIVPNFYKPGGYLCPDVDSVTNFLAFQETLNPNFSDSLKDKLILFGHSAGGISALETMATYAPPLKIKPFAIIFYGSFALKISQKQWESPPTLMMSGIEDKLITPEVAQLGFQNLLGNQNIHLQLANFDHFSITNNGTSPRYNDGKTSLFGIEATNIIGDIINKFILGCLSNSLSWLEDLNLDIIQKIEKSF